MLIKDIIIFTLLLVFIILYKKNDSFSMKTGYAKNINFVVIMNDYIIYIFLILIFLFILVEIFSIIKKTIAIKRWLKMLLFIFYSLIYIIRYILFMLKFNY